MKASAIVSSLHLAPIHYFFTFCNASRLAGFYKELTKSERELLALKRPGVGKAAFLIRDAILGDVENPAKGTYNPYANEEA